MSCTNHKIELKSSENSAEIHCEIFRLFGTIKNLCETDKVVIKTCQSDGEEKVVSVPIFKKTFKHLIRLKKDCENLVTINYCCANLELKIQQKSLDDVRFDVQPLFIIPKNHSGNFQTTPDDRKNEIEDARLKIDLALDLAQCVISTIIKPKASTESERIFELKKSKTFYSDLDVEVARKMNQWELYDAIAAELVEKFDVSQRKFVGFMSCSKFEGLKPTDEYSYENLKSKTTANPALGGGFLCLMGSGCFYCWPNHLDEVTAAFLDKKRVDTSQVLDDSNYRRSYGGCFATSLGSLIHEIGHVFDLAHTETGLMGIDVDYCHRFFLAENFTEILPKRILKSCQLTESGKSDKTVNQRFTRMKKPGEFLDKYREQKDNDLTFFESNCIVTLWNHRWFTQSSSFNKIDFDESTKTLKSLNSPLRLVEIRELSVRNSMLMSFWSLMDKDVNEFVVPAKLGNNVLFAVTRDGDIFKREFSNTLAS